MSRQMARSNSSFVNFVPFCSTSSVFISSEFAFKNQVVPNEMQSIPLKGLTPPEQPQPPQLSSISSGPACGRGSGYEKVASRSAKPGNGKNEPTSTRERIRMEVFGA